MNENRHKLVAKAIYDSIASGALIDLKLEGATGEKTVGILQRFAQLMDQNECYLEVGVYRGKSLLSVAKVVPNRQTFGIDNFSQFDKNGKNRQILEKQKNKNHIQNCTLINADFEDALENLEKYLGEKKVGLYFIDGPHDYRSQLMCLQLALPFLSENAIIVIDNSNYNHVRQANRDFLFTHPEYKLAFEAYSRTHPANLKGKELEDAWKNWLDGINVIFRDKKNELVPMYPPVLKDKTLFFNDHRIHPMRNSIFGYRAVKLAAVIKPFKPILFFGFLAKLFIEVRKRKKSEIEPFLFINSHSDGFPNSNINPSLIS